MTGLLRRLLVCFSIGLRYNECAERLRTVARAGSLISQVNSRFVMKKRDFAVDLIVSFIKRIE